MVSALKFHHTNMSVSCTPPNTPLLYSKTGVYRGIHNFYIFALKPRLWVLHYENTPVQYIVIFHGCKNDNFQMKNCDFFS